jgi:hypothetical protein
MVAVAGLVTASVVTVNVAVEDPAGTVTVAGTVAALVLLLDRFTVMPAPLAAPVRVTVPVDVVPPRTLVGLSDTAARATGDAPP